MNPQFKELSAARETFASRLHDNGADAEKARVLDEAIPPELAARHRSGDLHIHDLEAWSLVNNCSTPLAESVFRPNSLLARSEAGRIAELVDQVRAKICRVEHCQTGGIGFANFDVDLGTAFEAANIPFSEANVIALEDALRALFVFLSTQRLRYARENFYVTLNIGLAKSAWGHAVAQSCIRAFASLPLDYTRPNIVFKVKDGVNANPGDPNHDLFELSCDCTTKKMIPTYLLLDSEPNRTCDPGRIGIMGCRTRVYANRNGKEGSVGRGNIAAISMNLPRLAMKAKGLDGFLLELADVMDDAKRILLLRKEALARSEHVKDVLGEGVWAADGVEDMLRQGTYSIGFIGLSEAVEILTGGTLYGSPDSWRTAAGIVEAMRRRTDAYAAETGLNFSLLASAGEGISGRFPALDSKLFPGAEAYWGKGYYTNSFHVPVDSGVGVFQKLSLEGPYHRFANGGSISYVELREAPIGNAACVEDIVRHAVKSGVSYLGVNYPLDICRHCGHHGTFDDCPECGSQDIDRIRRVSGYLENLSEFSVGKKHEEARRRANFIHKED
jgi:ribonucleoside-triphosphate reductase